MKILSFAVLGFIFLFLFLLFFGTQKIYAKNIFRPLFLISLIIPFILLPLSDNEHKVTAINSGLIIFHYTLILWLIKKFYKKVNDSLIQKRLINSSFLDKDFTHVINSEYGNYWNEKIAFKPSWLDGLLSLALLFLPILLTLPVIYLV